MNDMKRLVRKRFRVTVDIDPEVWFANYGVVGSFEDDIEQSLSEVLQETMTAWIANTGNVGAVSVKPGGRVREVLS